MSQHEGIGLMQGLDVPAEQLEGVTEVTTQTYPDESTEAYGIYEEYSSKYETRWAADTLLHFPSTMTLLNAIDRAAEKKGCEELTGADVHLEMADGTFPGYGLMSDISYEDGIGGPSDAFILQFKNGKIEQIDEQPLK